MPTIEEVWPSKWTEDKTWSCSVWILEAWDNPNNRTKWIPSHMSRARLNTRELRAVLEAIIRNAQDMSEDNTRKRMRMKTSICQVLGLDVELNGLSHPKANKALQLLRKQGFIYFQHGCWLPDPRLTMRT